MTEGIDEEYAIIIKLKTHTLYSLLTPIISFQIYLRVNNFTFSLYN